MNATAKVESPTDRRAPSSPFGDVRVGPLLAIPLILGEHGVDLAPVLARIGLDARLFDLHERTLRRRLREEGATVRSLTGEVRRELLHHLLRVTDLPVSEVAAILRYSDVTVFSRAFRGWSNSSPHEWRAKAEALPGKLMHSGACPHSWPSAETAA